MLTIVTTSVASGGSQEHCESVEWNGSGECHEPQPEQEWRIQIKKRHVGWSELAGARDSITDQKEELRGELREVTGGSSCPTTADYVCSLASWMEHATRAWSFQTHTVQFDMVFPKFLNRHHDERREMSAATTVSSMDELFMLRSSFFFRSSLQCSGVSFLWFHPITRCCELSVHISTCETMSSKQAVAAADS